MARGDVDARAAAIVPHGKAQSRRRLESRVEIDRDAVCRQNTRRRLRKQNAVDAAVIGNRDLLGKLASGEPCGQALCGPCHGVDIHAVRARAEHTAKPRRAEGKVAAKAVRNFFRIALHREKLVCERPVKAGLHAPRLVALHCKIHANTSCLSVSYPNYKEDTTCPSSQISGHFL